jgi:hypothetical protein
MAAKKPSVNNSPNKNGANQYLLDPRQNLCWEYYVDPQSETFGNARQSAVRAGYELDYANQITTSEWFKVKLRRLGMLSKAERNLDEFMDMAVKTSKRLHDQEEVEVVETNPSLVKVKLDASKFVAERLGKDEGYSTRKEVTGKGGGKLEVSVEKREAIGEALDNL